MDKMKFETPNLTAENVTKIAELFPGVVTEGKVNFDLLRSMLGDEVYGDEAYEFTWVGKRAAIAEAGRPIRKTLRPCMDESKDWDTTENLYIEGDNLDVLKLLQESYLGKVKMIYIDPPYNTGNDFVYRDEFKRAKDEYDEEAGVYGEDGDRLFKNTETNGRFHSDWCSMIYPRLVLARNMLRDSGVIFISIDDGEVAQLRKICDEVFGESNFVAEIAREAIRGGSQSADIRHVYDYILCYTKNYADASFSGFEKDEIELNLEDERGKYAKGRELNKWGAGSRREDAPGMWFPIQGPDGIEVYPIRNDGTEGRWRLGKENMHKKVADGDVIFEKRDDGTYIVYEKIRGSKGGIKQLTSLFLEKYVNSRGTETLKSLFETNRALFDYSKPVELVNDLCILAGVATNDIVLDFFSGSATTAHAVMQLNAKDGGNRKFIMVQLPEVTDEKSEAFKVGYKNICEIGKERIRRAGDKIKANNTDKEGIENLDIGFRVLKLDDTNMNDVYYAAGDYTQDMIMMMESNIKPDRTDMDLLYACLLDWGLPLSMPHTHEKIDGFTVHTYNDGDLIACFEERISEKAIREIASRNPLRAVFRDSSFSSSPEKINVFETFKLLAPNTNVRVI